MHSATQSMVAQHKSPPSPASPIGAEIFICFAHPPTPEGDIPHSPQPAQPPAAPATPHSCAGPADGPIDANAGTLAPGEQATLIFGLEVQ